MKKILLSAFTALIILSPFANAQDLALSNVDIASVLDLGNAPYTLRGTIRNLGNDTVTNFNLNYSVDGGPVSTFTQNRVIEPNGGSYNFILINAWNPAIPKTYQLTVWTSDPNGAADPNTVNDSLTVTIQVMDGFVDRNALHEVFTSSTCPPCNPGNANLNAIFNNTSETPVILKYQMSWPGSGDPYYTAEGGVRRNYYNVSGVPNMAVDGGWNGNTNSYSNGLLDQFSAPPSILEIEANFTVDEPNQTVDLNFVIRPFQDISGSNILHVAIFENLTFNNARTNGETSFDHVMKKMLPNAGGTNVGTLEGGVPKTYNFNYTFNGSYRQPTSANNPINHATEHSVEEFNDLNYVAFVQNNSTREVYHASFGTIKATNVDLSAIQFGTPSSVDENTPVTITGELRNNQATIINSFDLIYKVNGGSEERETISGVTLNDGDTYTFNHSNIWTPTTPGFYKVEVYVDNVNGAGQNVSDDLALNDKISKYITVNSTVGLPVHEVAKSVNVYPNPSEGLVYIESKASFASSVEVYTMMGEKVKEMNLGSEGIYNLDMTAFESGIYILRFQSENGAFSKRVMID